MGNPLIGIVLDYNNGSEEGGYSRTPWYALRSNYAECIEEIGGVPIFIPYSHKNIEYYAAILDGVLIAGGDFDIDPKHYGQESGKNIGNLLKERTDFELAFVKLALQIGIPILGICGGMQLINVALGGGLIQHIEEGEVIHQQPYPKHIPSHLVEAGEEIYHMTGQTTFMVNSSHHQSVAPDLLGQDIIPCAWAPDDIIEAIILRNYGFCLGVQWHPEYMMTNEDRNILMNFIAASSEYADGQ